MPQEPVELAGFGQDNNAYTEEPVWRGEYYGMLSQMFTFAEGWIRHSKATKDVR